MDFFEFSFFVNNSYFLINFSLPEEEFFLLKKFEKNSFLKKKKKKIMYVKINILKIFTKCCYFILYIYFSPLNK